MASYVSNELTHFVGRSEPSDEARLALLIRIVRAGVLLDGRSLTRKHKSPITFFDVTDKNGGPAERHNYYPEPYYETRVDGSVASNEFVEPDMVCFCDIPHEPIELFRIHTNKYKRFGLAFNRAFLVAQGANPVFYLAKTAATPLRLVGEGGRFADFFDDTSVPSLLSGSRQRGAFFDVLKGRVMSAIELFRDSNQQHVATYRRGSSDPSDFKRRVFEAIDLPVGLFPYVFGYVKSFDPSLADDDPDNYYMEREWRALGKVTFGASDLARILVPPECVTAVREALPEFTGPITPLPE